MSSLVLRCVPRNRHVILTIYLHTGINTQCCFGVRVLESEYCVLVARKHTEDSVDFSTGQNKLHNSYSTLVSIRVNGK